MVGAEQRAASTRRVVPSSFFTNLIAPSLLRSPISNFFQHLHCDQGLLAALSNQATRTGLEQRTVPAGERVGPHAATVYNLDNARAMYQLATMGDAPADPKLFSRYIVNFDFLS